MSRAYRIRWRDSRRAPREQILSADQSVSGADSFLMDLCVLEILPADEMDRLLREALEEDGWAEDGDGTLTRTFEDAVAQLAEDGQGIIVSLETGERRVAAQSTDRDDLQRKLEQKADQQRQALSEQATRELLRAEPEVRAAVQHTLQKVYVEALKQKAAAMGEVRSVQESRDERGELELTIQIKV
jgi:hypothetical protein